MVKWRALVAATLLVPGTALAQAPEPPPYRYCSIRGADALSVVRSVRQSDGRAMFQSTLGNRLLGNEREFDAYLAWPGAFSDPPRLWISADWLTFISPGSVAIVIGGANDRDEAIVRRADRGDVTLFEVDPEALLRRFAGRRQVKLVFRSSAGTRPRAAATLDLEALRRELDAAAALAARFAGEPGACAETSLLRKEADPAQYECWINESAPTGSYSASPWRFQWQRRLSPHTYLDVTRNIDGQGVARENAFLGLLGRGFDAGGAPFVMLRVTSDSRLYRRTDLTGEFVAGEARLAVPLKDGAVVQWRALRGLGDGPIVFTVRDSAGAAVEQVTLPAGLFDEVDARTRTLAGQVLAMRDVPMQRCEPAGTIVVT